MAYEMVMPYHLHMPSYFLETFTEYPNQDKKNQIKGLEFTLFFNQENFNMVLISKEQILIDKDPFL